MSPTSDSSQSPIPDPVIDRYFAGTASAEERMRVEQWWQAALPQDKVERVLRTTELRPDLDSEYAVRTWAEIQRRIGAPAGDQMVLDTRQGASHESEQLAPRSRAVASRSRTRPTWWIAAGLGLALLGVFVPRALRHTLGHGRMATSNAVGAVYRTAPGQRATITLSDGSRVVLAPQSELRVASGYATDSRTLILTGEGYFDVAPAHALPFVVRSGSVETRVLGTAFDVRRYRSDTTTYVAVTTGKVLVQSRENTQRAYALTAGMAGTITDSMDVTVSTTAGEDYGTWRSGVLQFKNATLSDILATLTRWYGYEFQLADSSLAHRHVTAVLDASSSQEALATLKLLLDVDLTFSGSEITLTPRDRSRSAPPRRPIHKRSFPSTTEVGR